MSPALSSMLNKLSFATRNQSHQGAAPRRDNTTSSSPPGVLQLPVEVLILILRQLKSSEKSAVLQTCKALKCVVEPLLYEKVTLPLCDASRRLRLFGALTARPELAAQVRTMSGPFAPPYLGVKTSWNRLGTVLRGTARYEAAQQDLRQLTAALRLTANVQSLIVWDGSWISDPRYVDLRAAIADLDLRRLDILDPYPYPGNCVPIVETQPNLLHLHCTVPPYDSTSSVLPLAPEYAPRLTTLRMNVRQAAAVVPGRPITSLTLFVDPSGVPVGVWSGLSRSSARVVDLSFEYNAEGKVIWELCDLIIDIPSAFPFVRVLRLDGHLTDEEEVSRGISDMACLEELHFQRGVFLAGLRGTDSNPEEYRRRRDAIIAAWKTSCPTLKVVTISPWGYGSEL